MINGLSIIISSPSGAGKTSVTRKLLKKIKNSYLSISCTTRKPRDGEINGKDYFFISKKKFLNFKKNKKFLEHAKVYENFYGTLNSQVNANLKNNNIVLFDVDWQGAKSIKNKIKKKLLFVFFVTTEYKYTKKKIAIKA